MKIKPSEFIFISIFTILCIYFAILGIHTDYSINKALNGYCSNKGYTKMTDNIFVHGYEEKYVVRVECDFKVQLCNVKCWQVPQEDKWGNYYTKHYDPYFCAETADVNS